MLLPLCTLPGGVYRAHGRAGRPPMIGQLLTWMRLHDNLHAMKVYLVRHGHSGQAHAALSDPDRYLSAEGRRDLRKVGGWLREEKVLFDLVLTSPLVRAVQTAELLADAVDYLGVVESLACLAPGCAPQLAATAIAKRALNVAVVGHEPTISALGALLLGQPSFQPFRPGQTVLIEQGKPVWRMNPAATGVEPQF